ncbi:MAG: hypothetical protein ACKOYN_05215 [Planctomycetota bacterium]
MRDAVLGRDSVDVLVVGDSNSGFAGDGWLLGLSYGCAVFGGANMYGSPVLPLTDGPGLGLGTQSLGNIIGRQSADGSGVLCMPGSDPSGGAPASLVLGYSRGSGSASITGSPLEFAWFDTGSTSFVNYFASWYIAAGDGPEGALRRGSSVAPLIHRVVRGSSASAPPNSRFSVTWSCQGSMLSVPHKTREQSAEDGSWRWVASETPCPPEIELQTAQPWQVSLAGAGSGQGVEGQVAFATHSVYRQLRGWSVSMLGFRGGATMTGIASDIAALSGDNDTLGNILAEHRARQQSAGGRGRVAVFIQGGINSTDWWFGDPPNPSNRGKWSQGIESIQKNIRREWVRHGFPPEDLAFIVMVSHQADEFDHPLRFLRPLARSLACGTPDVCAVSSERLVGYAELSKDPGFYAWDGPYHLNREGFEEIGTRIIRGLLLHAAPSDLVPDGTVDAVDLSVLVADWGAVSMGGLSIAADIDRSGTVDAGDLVQLLADWGGPGE